MRHYSSYHTYHTQRGATLIVVLMLLLMISVVGVVALKRSTTDLKLATSDQVNTLLLQSADSSLEDLESIINDVNDPSLTKADRQKALKKLNDLVDNRSGMFGRFVLDKKNATEDVYSYCFNPTTDYFIGKATISRDGGTLIANGSCYQGGKPVFTTNMGVAMSQVNIRMRDGKKTRKRFEHYSKGVSATDAILQKTTFDITTTSFIPAYASVDASEYNKVYTDSKALVKFLRDNHVPYSTVYSEVVLMKKFRDPKEPTTTAGTP